MVLDGTAARLEALRSLMREAGVDALWAGTTDPHQSESVAPHWKAVQWLTGFTGSMGYAVVTRGGAEFWTDGRYTLQAEREIPPGTFHVNTVDLPGAVTWDAWLLPRLEAGSALAVDGTVLSEAMLRALKAKLPVPGLVIRHDRDLVGEIWEGRPGIPSSAVWEQDPPHAVETRPEKLARLRSRLGERTCELICGLDDAAWITNLRGGDNPLSPVFHAYALVGPETAVLCADPGKFPPPVREALSADGWELEPYEAIASLVEAVPPGSTLRLDPYRTPFSIFARVPAGVKAAEGPGEVEAMRARKSAGEQANIREAQLRECRAIVRLMMWIEENVPKGAVDEHSVGRKLEDFRRMDPLYLQPGNVPIVAYGEHGAIAHYRPEAEGSALVRPEGMLLFDVCAHYLCGTTDITRTVAVGPLSMEMKRDYTLMLKSHIALARQKFPPGTTGNLLDAVVKSLHWNRLVNFNHGTGHGIGYVLNIHDGPAKICSAYAPAFPRALETPLEEGMYFSDEPGVYRRGRYGVRVENELIVQKAGSGEYGDFLGFETVTFLPYEREAILAEELDAGERAWIDGYHAETFAKLSPGLGESERGWLEGKTRPLGG